MERDLDQMEILIRNEQQLPVKQTRLRQTVRKLLRAEGCPENVEVSVLLTGDQQIQELNKEYRDMDRPTDVLSFGQIDGAKAPCEAEGAIGDIVISVETATRQALSRDKDPDDELDLLVAHGALHLLGYDDETEAGAEEMTEKAVAVLGAKAVS